MSGTIGLTRAHRLLLDAALAPPAAAAAAWREWLVLAGNDDPDDATRDLAPLVQANLSNITPRDPALVRFKGLYRHRWYHDAQTLRRATGAMAALAAAGVAVVALDSIPLAEIYGAVGLRRIGGIDLLVAPADEMRAIDLLRQLGWQRDKAASITIFRSADDRLRLHTALLAEEGSGPLTIAIRQRSIAATIDGATIRVPDFTDQLLLILTHETRSEATAPALRIADAVTLLRSRGAQIDWVRLADLADKSGTAWHVGRLLRFLDQAYGCTPAEALAAFAGVKASPIERAEHLLGRVAPRSRTAIAQLLRARRLGMLQGRPMRAIAGRTVRIALRGLRNFQRRRLPR